MWRSSTTSEAVAPTSGVSSAPTAIGGPLTIRAQLEGSDQTAVRSVPDGPGPSIIDLPAAGCWRMTLTWSGHTDTLAIPYAP